MTIPLHDGATILVGDFNMSRGIDGEIADGRPGDIRMGPISQLWSNCASEDVEIVSPPPARRHSEGGPARRGATAKAGARRT